MPCSSPWALLQFKRQEGSNLKMNSRFPNTFPALFEQQPLILMPASMMCVPLHTLPWALPREARWLSDMKQPQLHQRSSKPILPLHHATGILIHRREEPSMLRRAQVLLEHHATAPGSLQEGAGAAPLTARSPLVAPNLGRLASREQFEEKMILWRRAFSSLVAETAATQAWVLRPTGGDAPPATTTTRTSIRTSWRCRRTT